MTQREENPASIRFMHQRLDTTFYIASRELDPKALLDAARAHWGVEKKLQWTMDVIFDEDGCRTRKDTSPLNLVIIRHAAFNILKADKRGGSLRRKPLTACIDPQYRTSLFLA
jgi:predicted transposase YbfD/YdcC